MSHPTSKKFATSAPSPLFPRPAWTNASRGTGFGKDSVLLIALLSASLLTGCGVTTASLNQASPDARISGTVYGGSQAITGAKLYLLAVGTGGYAGPQEAASTTNASVSLLNPSKTGNSADTVGSYILTGTGGSFSLSSEFSCTTGYTQGTGATVTLPGTEQVYLYALGGNTGSGTNAASGLLAGLGACNKLSSATKASLNEVTTVGTAYALAGFATDATHISSDNNALSLINVTNAAANTNNLVSIAGGTALSTTPAANGGNGTVPAATIYSIADILAACVNTTGGTGTGQACGTLLNNAQPYGTSGGVPTDTATAAINIAHTAGVTVSTLFGLIPATGAPFSGGLASQPNDLALSIIFTGGGLKAPSHIAIDGSGNVWAANFASSGGTLAEFANDGEPLSTSAGFGTAASESLADSLAIDTSGNAWLTNNVNDSVREYSSSGALTLTSAASLTGGTKNSLNSLAFDKSGHLWVAGTSSLTDITISGSTLTPTNYSSSAASGYSSLAIDTSSDVYAMAGSVAGSPGYAEYAAGSYSNPELFTPSGSGTPYGSAIDEGGNVWYTTSTEVVLYGTYISGAYHVFNGYNYPLKVVIDGNNTAWVANYGGNSLGYAAYPGSNPASEPANIEGSGLNAPADLAIDGAGDIWVANSGANTISEFIGMAAPVATPFAEAVITGTGNRP